MSDRLKDIRERHRIVELFIGSSSKLSKDVLLVYSGSAHADRGGLLKMVDELLADKADLVYIATEQENAHVAANMRCTDLEQKLTAETARADAAEKMVELVREVLTKRFDVVDYGLKQYYHPDGDFVWAMQMEEAMQGAGDEAHE